MLFYAIATLRYPLTTASHSPIFPFFSRRTTVSRAREFLAEPIRRNGFRSTRREIAGRNGGKSIDGQKRLEYLKVRPCAGLRSINAPVSNYFVMIIVTCLATMRPDPIPIISNERFDQKLSMVRRWNNIYLKLHPAHPPFPLFIAEPID